MGLRLRKVSAATFKGSLETGIPRQISLRTQLVILVLGVVLPLFLLAAAMFWRDVQLQRAAVERGMKDTARALSLALDRELGKVQAILETLAASPHLDLGDFKSFFELTRRAAERRKWSWVVLFDRSGQEIINTREPFGASLPNILREASKTSYPAEEGLPLGSPATVKKVLETGEPVVSDLFRGLVSKRPSVAISSPVVRNAKVTYGISMVTVPENLTNLLREEGLPGDWYAVIVDRNGMIISQNPEQQTFVGRRVSATFSTLINQSEHGWAASEKWNGVPFYSAFARSKLTGWTVAIGAPQAKIEGAANHALRIIGAGAALLLLIALGTALILGRRIAKPISALAKSAEAIQRGEPVDIESSGIKEISELHSAVCAAAEATRQWAAERERAVIGERLRRLAEISASLAESINFEQTLKRLAELIVPDYADWCCIDLLQEDSDVCRRVAVRASSKDKEQFAEELYRHYAPDLSRPDPIIDALKTGRSDYTLNADQAWIDQRARDQRHHFLLRQMEAGGVIIVPLRVQGRVAGALSMYASQYSRRNYTIADVEFAEEVGRRASTALDNAWLYGQVQKELAERKHAEAALRESEERFRSTFENAAIGMAHVGPGGRWLRVNDTLCEITGYSREELLAKTVNDITYPEDLKKDQALARRVLAGELSKYSLEKRYVRKDGSLVWVETTVSLRTAADGRPLHFIGSVEDISERKRAQRALREADRRKDEFLAMLGHELRNPLGVITTVLELLRIKGPPDPELGELRDTIDVEVRQLSRLLDDLLDISRIARGLIRLKKEPCDLAMIARQVADGRRSILAKNGVGLSVELPPQPVWVIGDPTRLAQIVGNLLENANKFTDAGGRVTLRLVEQAEQRMALLSIRDTGIGMEPEMLEQVFQPFAQADRTIERSRGGLGLGLALVKGLVDLHGGEVWATSDGPGHGSEVTIRLPLSHQQDSVVEPAESVSTMIERRRILIIEDNLAAGRSLRVLLSQTGHTVDLAHNGPEGIQTARRFRPDVVLCDIGLPGLDGYEVARLLRQEPASHGIYLIAVSGYGQEVDQLRALNEGFDAYLTKPIDLKKLDQLLTTRATFEHRSRFSMKQLQNVRA
jgi:PAS domain S-box-containing protein